MRSLTPVLHETVRELQRYSGSPLPTPTAEFLCQVELGLYLQQQLMPDSPAGEAWVLFSGYGFAKAYGILLPPDAERTLRVARYSLWTLARRRAWREALDRYQRLAQALRGYDVTLVDSAAVRQETWVGKQRWQAYDHLLTAAPPLAGRRRPVAGSGPHAFPVGRTLAVVDLPEVTPTPLVAHDLDLIPAGGGEPLTFRRAELARTAAAMDAEDRRRGELKKATWAERLRGFDMSIAELGTFRQSDEFTVDGIQHLLGIVGAGKSTLRDIIAVHLARQGKRTTVVVPDVAEVLKLVELYNRYTDGAAAPVLGSSGRERHAQRLHRRLAGRGEHRLLAHDDPAFDYLGTSCVLNLKLRGGTGEPLAYGESPCSRLRRPADPRRQTRRVRSTEWQREFLTCPYWSACPRHHGPRALVGAEIWVATLPGLIDSAPPYPQNGERIRFLELACRRSDLVIIDEVDRVQMHLDRIFAPAVLLAADEERGLIDQLSRHKIRELAAGGRTQLSDRDVEIFCAAVNTVVAATDRLHAMLVAEFPLRRWVGRGYFSAWTLQLNILNERFALPEDAAADHPHRVLLEKKQKLLEAFRDNPFGDRHRYSEVNTSDFTVLLNEVLHTGNPEQTRTRLLTFVDKFLQLDKTFMAEREEQHKKQFEQWKEKEELRKHRPRRGKRVAKEVPPPQTPEQWRDSMADRFELTLLLSALEPRLALINAMYPRVEAALSLGFNDMYRRPNDYAPMVPEAPMGNVLGFQFLVHGQDGEGVRSGELTFFRCSGVGRELLRAMPGLAGVDGRPGAHVLLMSGSSWAGQSSRYHVQIPVGVVIEPPSRVMDQIAAESTMRFEFIDDGPGKLRVSGSDPADRPDKLRRIATWLGVGAEDIEDGGPLEQELLSLPPERDQILLLVGSYQEARLVADTLHNLNERWRHKVLCLVSDDDEIEEEDEAPSAQRARTLRRGDVERLRDLKADILVAPLLSVERGHNILNRRDEAAIGSVYFLARPNPHPDDLSLAVHAVNDWIVRAQADGLFGEWVRRGSSLEEGAEAVRKEARSCWYRVLQRSMAWSRLEEDRAQVTWDILVLMWQVIGRLVRGGVPARVVFVDSAFAPNRASCPPVADTSKSSLLHSILEVLDPYFQDGLLPAGEEFIVRALYRPLWRMLGRCLAEPLPPA
ncbi:pPIWI_RE_Z domain-containing protein [Streptomyces sp. NPDC004031]